jgi:hypothetical protein
LSPGTMELVPNQDKGHCAPEAGRTDPIPQPVIVRLLA